MPKKSADYDDEYDPAYKPKDAAIYCGCSVDSLIRWGVKRHRVHKSVDGLHDRYIYRQSDLNAHLRSQGRPVPTDGRRRTRDTRE